MSTTNVMLDTPIDLCQFDVITAPVPETVDQMPCVSNGAAPPKTSSWGGPRPGFGGPQPGSGRPPKPKPLIIVPTYATDEPRWCVVSYWGQAEQSATTELTRIGYEAYLPLVAIRRRDPVIASKFHTIRVPLFSGYGFIRLTQTESREPITATRGVREVLRRPDGRAASVPDILIEKLRGDDVNRLLLPKEHGPVLKVNAKVRIEEGPFLSHIGTVVQCDGVQTQVEVNIFGRPTPLWMDRTSVVVV